MKTVRVLSIILLAAFLTFQGLYYFSEETVPVVRAAIGLLGLISGVLMFISLGHWIDIRKEK